MCRGGIHGSSGTGRRSSRQACPATSAPTRRQKRAAPGFSSWNAISQRPECNLSNCRVAACPTCFLRAAAARMRASVCWRCWSVSGMSVLRRGG